MVAVQADLCTCEEGDPCPDQVEDHSQAGDQERLHCSLLDQDRYHLMLHWLAGVASRLLLLADQLLGTWTASWTILWVMVMAGVVEMVMAWVWGIQTVSLLALCSLGDHLHCSPETIKYLKSLTGLTSLVLSLAISLMIDAMRWGEGGECYLNIRASPTLSNKITE